MDPLCHTLVGASLAATRLGDRSWGAAASLVVAANLPDVDVVAYAWSADAALLWRRGWTHGVLAIALLPMLLAAVVIAVGRARGAPVRPGWILALSALGVLTHPLLDWMNTYGMRWLVPFDGRWFYGDALFIVDPWLWLLLGGAAFLRFSRSRRAVVGWGLLAVLASVPVLGPTGPGPLGRAVWIGSLLALAVLRAVAPPSAATNRRIATVALALTAIYVGGMLGSVGAAESAVRERLGAIGTPLEVYAGPIAADPLARDLLVVDEEGYRPGRLAWRPAGPEIAISDTAIPLGDDDPRVAAALAAPCARGMADWLRYPFYRVEETPEGSLVHLLDARYVRRPDGGFGATRVRLDRQGRVLACR